MGIDVESRRQQREKTPTSAPLSSLGLKGDSGALADLVAQLPHVYDSAMQTRQTSAFVAGESLGMKWNRHDFEWVYLYLCINGSIVGQSVRP